MDKFEILGIEDVNYTNKSGRVVKGLRLHLGCNNPKYHGVYTETVFLPQRLVDSYEDKSDLCINLHDKICIYYNRYGSVADFVILEE